MSDVWCFNHTCFISMEIASFLFLDHRVHPIMVPNALVCVDMVCGEKAYARAMRLKMHLDDTGS